MSADDTPDDNGTDSTGDDSTRDGGDTDRRDELTERLEEGTDRAVDEFDQRLVDLLAWMLDTETRARIYVYLRQNEHSTSEEIAEGTGLYPSTVREALAELTDEGTVTRQKRESEGAGNNPYEYAAIPPSDLVGSIAEQVQQELNTVFNLDRYLTTGEDPEADSEPVTITVSDVSEDDDDGTGDGEETPEQDSDD
jgi:predicted transcriptional regulator